MRPLSILFQKKLRFHNSQIFRTDLIILITLIIIPHFIAGDDTCTNPSPHLTQWKNSPIKESVYEPKCVYYLAPSSIPNAGFGTYTVRDIEDQGQLMNQADAPIITVSNYGYHNKINENRSEKIPFAVHLNYFTDGSDVSIFEMDGETDDSVVNFAFVNHHSYLVNIHHSDVEINDIITSRESGSPGIGK